MFAKNKKRQDPVIVTKIKSKGNASMATKLKKLSDWVDSVVELTHPKEVYWCDGSEAEYKKIVSKMLSEGSLTKLNETKFPNSYLHLSDPNDVARTEHLTFVCTTKKETAGPNNNWMSPQDGHAMVDKLFEGAMNGRTLYVIPYCMGPIDSPFSRCGVEVTDSPYVVINMKKMTRMGAPALKRIEKEGDFVKGLHSTGDLSITNRRIMHFPEENTIKSIGSGYGGNALLGKKCHALRIASFQGKTEGWLAEHMLILGIESPEGKTEYVAAAFPSACGKTNLAMLIPPEQYQKKGWKVWTVGDDIAWMHLGEDGQLWAINPEAGFFGVAPGTSAKTNPNALEMVGHDTIFTNVAVTKDNCPWWEGINNDEVPVTDWQGRPYDPANGPAAHANSRFTVSAKQCSSYSPKAEDPKGVPISAIIFGGRRANVAPLVVEAKNWAHGVLTGASVASETTAAATGKVGVKRHDPMAMLPFCGYNFGDYWAHWLSFGKKSDKLPKVFHVNWFRKNDKGAFMWPGFGDNIRVLEWILKRCNGQVGAQETPIGNMPNIADLNLSGAAVDSEGMAELTTFKKDDWMDEVNDIEAYLKSFDPHVPRELFEELSRVRKDLQVFQVK